MQTPKWLRRAVGMPGTVSFTGIEPSVVAALSLLPDLASLSSPEFLHRAQAFDGTRPEALALAADASSRGLGVVPFREQLRAAAAMLDGFAVEMDTGEGKTLAGALAAAGHALAGRSVHVISVNDYLARRDAEWMRPLYAALGIQVAAVGEASTTEERRAAYRAEVTYASVSEVGYDVLRDRFCVRDDDRVDPRMDVAIVDEADAVMIDEAIVPLVLAGSTPHDEGDTAQAAAFVRNMTEGADYVIDAEGATVGFTDEALDTLEARLGGVNLYASAHIPTLTALNLALHARVLMHRDVDYVIEDGELRLVNTSRGRIADGQRWPDGLHAAVEAKEGLQASGSGVILDTLTVQDLLLQYPSLTGMSGTMLAVADELIEFYEVPCGRVERRLPQARVDEPDLLLDTEDEVFAAVAAEVERRHGLGQPVLVGTQSIADSEAVAAKLTARGLELRVLNAKNDETEAQTVARAGERDAVTISTQMSGRGTDILLGGADAADHDAVAARGGLAVIQVGLYPSRRLDAQLRGRAGRQGDPGVSVRICSLHDDLIVTTATRTIRAQIDSPAALTDRARQRIVRIAQDISEALRADAHRATWGYNRAITRQRQTVLAERRTISTSDDLLGERMGDIPGLEADDPAVTDAVREIALLSLDDVWCEHLQMLQSVRDGIHLRALGGQNPLDEFHRLALAEFDGFFDRAYADARRLISATGAVDVAAALAAARQRRPSATWTYMVSDDPLGDAASRAADSLRAMWAGRRKGR
ncbi:accessory Sec system translocase SecA2 [Microbacterium sp. MYb62]|uniref:accessory Sec system translocase SecA2 n=1 Tax=Microbacterium sp. MYb62 TaxID=1848690 RepID=UPI000CFD35D8|nr:accessory Sec system translocase SecA2 [Microbacterium sp. MYb62]PRB18280.1 accessory Sec system translocase SecA2 [Microbacterium sp. MYb62]